MDEPSQPDRPPSADPAARVRFDVTWTAGSAHAAAVEPLLTGLADALSPRSGEARVRVINDAEMAAAHERYKNVAGTTDVLTFDLAGNPNEPLDADVLVCIDEAERQASERGIPVAHELLLYITHAVLHCSGFNDDTDANAAAMHAREDDLLVAIGIGPVYAASAEHTR
ncbi:MAG: rRNA maturation RNase YbeY [Planctomycetota bacterium]